MNDFENPPELKRTMSMTSKSKSKSSKASSSSKKSKRKNTDGVETAVSGPNSQSASHVTNLSQPLGLAPAAADEEMGMGMSAGMMVDGMMVDDIMEEEDQVERKVGSIYKDLNCLCNPTRARSPGEICSRLGKWCVGNANQIVSSIIGKCLGHVMLVIEGQFFKLNTMVFFIS